MSVKNKKTSKPKQPRVSSRNLTKNSAKVTKFISPRSSGTTLDVRSFREEKLGLSRKLFSRLSGYSERALAEWESGKTLSSASKQKMTELVRLQHALAKVIKEEFIPDWLQTPNEAFDGLKPLEVVERGEMDRLWRMIYLLESGVPS